MAKSKRFSLKEDRQAADIAASEKARGKSPKTARSIGYATVVAGKKKSRGKRKM